MVIRLYIDEDAMARALVQSLRARNVDVLTVLEAEMEGQSDPAQLAYATEQGRVIFTFNVGDYCRLHTEYLTQNQTHAGIVTVARQKYSIGEQGKKLANLVNIVSAEEMMNQLRFL